MALTKQVKKTGSPKLGVGGGLTKTGFSVAKLYHFLE